MSASNCARVYNACDGRACACAGTVFEKAHARMKRIRNGKLLDRDIDVAEGKLLCRLHVHQNIALTFRLNIKLGLFQYLEIAYMYIIYLAEILVLGAYLHVFNHLGIIIECPQ